MSIEWTATGGCPQCGGKVEMEVGDSILDCTYCRTSLYLAPHGPLRYKLPIDNRYLSDAGLPTEDVFYMPFWRVRGLRFNAIMKPPSVVGTYQDATLPASELIPGKSALGVRPQTSKLTLAYGDERKLPETVDEEGAGEGGPLANAVYYGPRPIFSRLIGDTKCVIYAPFFLDRSGATETLVEAMGDGFSHALTQDQSEALNSALNQKPVVHKLDFLPLVCDQCGQDLNADHGSVALVCEKCVTAWWLSGDKLVRIPFHLVPSSDLDDRYFPFWNLTFDIDGLPIGNMAELIRWALPYKLPGKELEAVDAQLFVPGFKTSPRTFLRLAKGVSLLGDVVEGRSGDVVGHIRKTETVRLPLAEAAQAVKPVLSLVAKAKERNLPLIRDAKVKVKGARLVFLPFRSNGREWVETRTGQAVTAGAVELGRKL